MTEGVSNASWNAYGCACRSLRRTGVKRGVRDLIGY